MTVLRVQVSIPRDTQIPADACINTWHFQSAVGASVSDAADAAVVQLNTFYQVVDQYLASYMLSPAVVKCYDLSDPEPRIPVLESSIVLTTATLDGFPAECAMVLSYRGGLVSGENPARRRGRIFLGPLDDGVGDLASGDMEIASSVRTVVTGAASAMVTSGLTFDSFWVVFSPTSAGPPPWSVAVLEDSSTRVGAGYVDNAFDTVRSRGFAPTARTTFSVVLP